MTVLMLKVTFEQRPTEYVFQTCSAKQNFGYSNEDTK